MTLSPRDVLIRLAQQYAGSGPVRCRWCASPWGHHANGCQAQAAIAALTGYSGAPDAADGVVGTSMHEDSETQPRAGVGPQDSRTEDERWATR